MAENNINKPYVSHENVTNKITLSCTKGSISQYTALKTGNLISIAFVLTLTSNVSANEEIGIIGTYSESHLKAYQRSQIGGTNYIYNPMRNFLSTTTGNFSVLPSGNISSGTAFWLHFMYICSD